MDQITSLSRLGGLLYCMHCMYGQRDERQKIYREHSADGVNRVLIMNSDNLEKHDVVLEQK